MRLPRLLPLFGLVLSLAACSDPAGAAGDVEVRVTEVRTDPTISGPDVIFKVRNTGGAPVYLQRCGERVMSAVDVWAGVGWQEFNSDFCLASIVSIPLELRPGEEVTSSQVVHRAGRYRLRVGVYLGPGEGPDWNAAATEFTIPE